MKNGEFIGADGTIYWYKNNELHREDGPAVIWPDGRELWYENNKLHREDGPAVTYADGSEFWYKHGKLHREDGLAIIEPDGITKWFYNDICYVTLQEFAKAAGWTDNQLAEYLLRN